jgi:hypothetical protein
MKVPVINRKDYTIFLEYFNDVHWLHTDVYKWSSKIKKQYIKELNQLQSLLSAPLYGLVDNDKLDRFGKTIGFSFLQEAVGNDGQTYKIYIRS